MPKKKTNERPSPRPDLLLKESDYIEKIKRPNFEITRDERLRDGHRRGLPMANLMKSSGYTPRQLFSKLGLDEAENYKIYDELCRVYDQTRGTGDGKSKHF